MKTLKAALITLAILLLLVGGCAILFAYYTVANHFFGGWGILGAALLLAVIPIFTAVWKEL